MTQLKRILPVLGFIFVLIFNSLAFSAQAPEGAEGETASELELFVGSATKPATEEAARIFQEKYGVKVNLHFGGSGAMLSQMILSKKGDAYFPGSSDFMEKAKRKGVVLPDTEKIVVYLISAINVQKGNPKDVRNLEDLTRPGLRIAIANPKTVCVGLYAAEVLDKAGLADKVRPNIATYTESCAKTCQIVAFKNVDAVIGWRVFQHWSPENVETILLPPKNISRIGYVPIAISRFCQNRPLARKFIDFVTSPEGKEIYKKWNYLTTEKEARKFAPQAKVGGEWFLPDQWQ